MTDFDKTVVLEKPSSWLFCIPRFQIQDTFLEAEGDSVMINREHLLFPQQVGRMPNSFLERSITDGEGA